MSGAANTIHLINPFWDAAGGSEGRAVSLYEMLSQHRPTRLWSYRNPDRRLAARFPLERLSGKRLRFPRAGTFVFIGVYFDIGRWIHLVRPRRIILIYNTVEPARLTLQLERLSRFAPIELVYASEDLRAQTRHEGIFEPSLLDLGRFVPRPGLPRQTFTVGRLSRPAEYKHHPQDAHLYRMLAAQGIQISLMGASPALGACLARENIAILPPCAVGADDFLRGLDCFYYRTSDAWTETWGRVVFEAMACGLPVICHRRGGYAPFIDHGRNGFLFDRQEEALELLFHLRDRPELRFAVGQAARRTVEEIFSVERRRAIMDFYLK